MHITFVLKISYIIVLDGGFIKIEKKLSAINEMINN